MKACSLKKHPQFEGRPGPLLLVILDGVGLGDNNNANAVHLAKTPCLDKLSGTPLFRPIKAHGKAVGMPTDDDMGNSEVGHNALGAGRIFDQGASLVRESLNSGALFKRKTWINSLQNCKQNNATLHLIGLLSDGNVHSHVDHLLQMLTQAAKENISTCRIHILLDGRDVDPKSALTYIEKVESHIDQITVADKDYAIASGGGRMITTMDRYDADWSIVERGWNAHVLGIGRPFQSATEAIQTFYNDDPTRVDQYLPAFVITKFNKPIGTIEDGDSVIFFNFRGDRAIELCKAFEDDNFTKFDRKRTPKVHFSGMMQYDGDLKIPNHFLVTPPKIDCPLSEYLCAEKVKSFAISETQKYGHVTYFWNGNKSGYINQSLEKYIEIPSDKIPFDQAPDMKANEITEKTIELLKSSQFKFGRINFPNGDMVGHTGVLSAAIQSMETTDKCLSKLIDANSELQGVTIVLADHGNADEMFIQKKGKIIAKTSHTLNPVPFAIIDPLFKGEYKISNSSHAGLANVASTICNLLGYEQPEEYEPSLIQF
jgi:2,3-bisphosphoglycerate-independent phosphoglycerate mutase